MNKTKGNTFVEILIAVAILAIILVIVVPSLVSFRNEQALKNTTEDIVSLLNQARMNTLSSQNSTYYSVRFENNRAILFTGGSFAEGAVDNKIITFDSNVTLPSDNISLNGEVDEINFTRLSGDTEDYGTITIELASNGAVEKVITIQKTGIVSAD